MEAEGDGGLRERKGDGIGRAPAGAALSRVRDVDDVVAVSVATPMEEAVEPEAENTSVGLPGADTLAPGEASAVLCAWDARILAIAGPVNSGKTSLIAGLYDLFQRGPLGDMAFAGSRTLHGFERACHDARSASRREVPAMERTARGGVRFYHLQVAGGSAGGGVALLFGDRSGEEYEDLAEDVAIAQHFCEVTRADSLTILVDGDRLRQSSTRHEVRSEVLFLLQALRDGDAVRGPLRVALVLTKLDAVKASVAPERADGDFETLVRDVRDRFAEMLAVVEPFRIAASPKTNVVQRGTGLEALLRFWVKGRRHPLRGATPRVELTRAFARLPVTTAGQVQP